MIEQKITDILWEINRLKREVNYVECAIQERPNSNFIQMSTVWGELDDAEHALQVFRKSVKPN